MREALLSAFNFITMAKLKINKTTNNQGFTLIEVIAAVMIVSFALLASMSLVSNHVNTLVEVEKRLLASWVASNHMAELRFNALHERIKPSSDTERYDMGGQRWRSKARFEKTELDDVFLVTIEVVDDNGGDKAVYASINSAIKGYR